MPNSMNDGASNPNTVSLKHWYIEDHIILIVGVVFYKFILS